MNTPNLKIMDFQVPVAVQMEFMQMLKKASKTPANPDAIKKMQQQLLDSTSSMFMKKKLLQKLCIVENIEVLRFLEQYTQNAASDIKGFAQMAAFHCRIYIESGLLGEPQMVVASGMGGKENCLRFFVALIPVSAKRFSEPQMLFVKKEFAYIFEDFNAEIENEIDFTGKYPKFTMLVPFQIHPGKIISDSIKACNDIGNVLRDGAIISNVKSMDDKEIDKMWLNVKRQKKDTEEFE